MASVDPSSLLDRDVPSPEQKGKVSKKSSERGDTGSVSAAIARENARLAMPGPTMPRFPGEDSGRSLAEMARADLDAALQLLADRAQYITGASGAAIALRRSEHNDMLCRARVGSNAPELGALLSMEYGLSGESVRTGQLLRCDDAERDPRVNRDLCRELGIASAVIMPILKEQQVLGVFELFSGKAAAFNERDLSALTRLAEMVVTAVKHSGLDGGTIAPAKSASKHQSAENGAGVVRTRLEASTPTAEPPSGLESSQDASPAKSEAPSSRGKPLFWSAALQSQAGSRAAPTIENSAAPPVLRNLKKCQVCGFPISPGRTYCVECEEKQWHGRAPAHTTVARSAETSASQPENATAPTERTVQVRDSAPVVPADQQPAIMKLAVAAAASSTGDMIRSVGRAQSSITEEHKVLVAAVASSLEAAPSQESGVPIDRQAAESSIAFLSSATPSESWFAANKVILLALLIVVLILGAIAAFR